MPLIVWTDRMSVGVKLLDNDHKKLVLLANELHDKTAAGRNRKALENIFEELANYTRLHFYHEERLLAETGYHGSVTHRQEHDQLLEQLMELQLHFTNSQDLAHDMEVMNRLRVWLFKHIQGADQEFVPHFKTKSVDSILSEWGGHNRAA
jgi:hemerythrin